MSSLYLHKHPIRGDVALLIEISFFWGAYTIICSDQTLEMFACLRLSILPVAAHLGVFGLSVIMYRLSPFHPLAAFPGPWVNKVTSLRLVYITYSGRRHIVVDGLHQEYGKFVRTGKISVL